MFILIAAVIIWFSHSFNSIFLQVISGFLTIAAGIEFLTRGNEWIYLVFGVSIIAIGFYQWIVSAIDIINRGED